jgi:hypothetical protein
MILNQHQPSSSPVWTCRPSADRMYWRVRKSSSECCADLLASRVFAVLHAVTRGQFLGRCVWCEQFPSWGEGYIQIDCSAFCFWGTKVEKMIKGERKEKLLWPGLACYVCARRPKSAWKPTLRRRRRQAFVFVVSMVMQRDATPQLGVTGEEMPRMDTDPTQMALLRAPRLARVRRSAVSGRSSSRTVSGHIFTHL